MKILAIESSCDETAAAIVTSDKQVLAECVVSQLEEHAPYGGVVPEIAARAHLSHIDRLIAQVMEETGIAYKDLDAVAATSGPGLIGGLIVGVMTAKAIAHASSIPFLAMNHLEGHALAVRLVEDVPFPYLLLLVSGGHCQFLAVEGVGKYRKLGGTIDDALGEAFDKVAKMLGLDYPGGPIVERLAKQGNSQRFVFPHPLKNRAGCDFSFSGLKTAVKLMVDSLPKPISTQDQTDICASFQQIVGEIIASRIEAAIEMFQEHHPESRRFVLGGGVAANQYIRKIIEQVLQPKQFTLHVPPGKLCTDNAAMIGWAAIERLQLGEYDSLDTTPRARWPLDPRAAR